MRSIEARMRSEIERAVEKVLDRQPGMCPAPPVKREAILKRCLSQPPAPTANPQADQARQDPCPAGGSLRNNRNAGSRKAFNLATDSPSQGGLVPWNNPPQAQASSEWNSATTSHSGSGVAKERLLRPSARARASASPIASSIPRRSVKPEKFSRVGMDAATCKNRSPATS